MVGASINAAVEDGDVCDVHSITLVANVISIFHLFLVQVEDHDAEATGHIGQVTIKVDMVDALVAHDVLVLDVAHVGDLVIAVDEVDISIGVGHKQLMLAFVVAYRADADVRQAVDFVEDVDGVIFGVVIKQLVFCGGIDLMADGLHANHLFIGEMGAPLADGDAILCYG